MSSDVIKLRKEFEFYLETTFTGRNWNFSTNRNGYESDQMQWMFSCYIMGKQVGAAVKNEVIA